MNVVLYNLPGIMARVAKSIGMREHSVVGIAREYVFAAEHVRYQDEILLDSQGGQHTVQVPINRLLSPDELTSLVELQLAERLSEDYEGFATSFIDREGDACALYEHNMAECYYGALEPTEMAILLTELYGYKLSKVDTGSRVYHVFTFNQNLDEIDHYGLDRLPFYSEDVRYVPVASFDVKDVPASETDWYAGTLQVSFDNDAVIEKVDEIKAKGYTCYPEYSFGDLYTLITLSRD